MRQADDLGVRLRGAALPLDADVGVARPLRAVLASDEAAERVLSPAALLRALLVLLGAVGASAAAWAA